MKTKKMKPETCSDCRYYYVSRDYFNGFSNGHYCKRPVILKKSDVYMTITTDIPNRERDNKCPLKK